MRARAHLAEEDIVPADEHLHAEDAVAAQGVRDFLGDVLRLCQGLLAHRLRLPGLAVIAVHLVMADGIEEGGAAGVPDGEEGDLIIELHEALHDHLAGTGPAALLGDVPALVGIGRRLADALPVTGRTHDGFHHAGGAHGRYGGVELLAGGGKTVVGSGQAEGLVRQLPDALAVHGEEGRVGRGDHMIPLLLQLHQRGRRDGLHLRDDDVRLLLLDDFPQPGPVQHRQDITAMSHLHGRRILIPIQRNYLNAKPLQFNSNLFTQFSRAAQQGLLSNLGERSTDFYHNTENL